MKIALVIAVFVLGQCLVTDAWFVKKNDFYRERDHTAADRRNMKNQINSLYHYRNSHDSQLNGIQNSINSLHRQRVAITSEISRYRSYVSNKCGLVNTLNRNVDDHDRRIRRLESASQALYAPDMLTWFGQNLL